MRFDDIVGRADRSWIPFAAILATAPGSAGEVARRIPEVWSDRLIRCLYSGSSHMLLVIKRGAGVSSGSTRLFGTGLRHGWS